MGRNSRGFLTGITTWWRKKIIAVRHSFYRKRLVRRLTNLAPSILSLDCVGGVMAHDLRLRFNSPTVNLFFESCGDFIDYVADLRYYSQAELCECPYAYEGARRYPVGMLKGNGTLPDIKIHFLHYRSFEEAREKWLERSGRLDFDNLCVVMQAAELDEGLLERFERLPISRKVILGYHLLPANPTGHVNNIRTYTMGVLAVAQMGRCMGEVAYKVSDSTFLWCNALLRRLLCATVIRHCTVHTGRKPDGNHSKRTDNGGLLAKQLLLRQLLDGGKYRGTEMPKPRAGLGSMDDT